MNDEIEVPDSLYFSGGLLAFGISTIIILILDVITPQLIRENIIFKIFQVIIVFFISGSISGYLISERLNNSNVSIGIKTGLIAFLINMLYMTIYQSFSGGLWAIIGYVVGGVVGTQIWAKFKERLL